MKEKLSTVAAVNSQSPLNNNSNGYDDNDDCNAEADADAGDRINGNIGDNRIEKSPSIQLNLSKSAIHNNQNVKKSSTTLEKRVERNLWRPDEVLCMLYAMQNIKAIEQLNNKNVKSEKVFKHVEKIMFSNGFRKKSHAQIWTKWKFLKSTYNTSRRNGIMPRIVSPEIYKELHKMLHYKHVKTNITNRVNATANGSNSKNNLSDCTNSDKGSMDDCDNNSINAYTDAAAATTTTTATTTITTNGIIISDVTSGLNPPNGIAINDINHVNHSLSENDLDMANEQMDNNLNIAHPIFGFRLGLIKPEPNDTGYETIEQNGSGQYPFLQNKNSSNNKNINNNLVPTASNVNINVKQEIVDENEGNVNENLRLSQELNGLTSNQTSTPNEKLTNGVEIIETCNMKLPPLRVALFAQTTAAKVTDGRKIPSRPPPPLTMPPTARPIYMEHFNNIENTNNNHITLNSNNYRSVSNSKYNNTNKYNNIKNGSTIRLSKSNIYDPKLSLEAATSSASSSLNMGPKISMGPNVPPIRLSKEITVQQTTNKNSITPSDFPKLKQVPMRKTPYSLRPDRVIPDLDSSDSPPPTSETSSCHYMDDDLSTMPATNNMSNSTIPMKLYTKRKRRLDWQDHYTTTIGTTEATTTATTIPPAKIQKLTNNSYKLFNENPDITNIKESIFQEHADDAEKGEQKENYEKLVTNVIRDVTTTLREMQREMMQGFFKTQQDLIRQEHAFQMQQDEMLMKVFQEQTRNIMNTITNLMMNEENQKQPDSQLEPHQSYNHHHYHKLSQHKMPQQVVARPRGRPRKYHNHIIQKQQQKHHQQQQKQQQHVAYRKKYLKHVTKTKKKQNVEDNDEEEDKDVLTTTADLYSDDANEEDLQGYKEAEDDCNSDNEQHKQTEKQQQQPQEEQDHHHQQQQQSHKSYNSKKSNENDETINLRATENDDNDEKQEQQQQALAKINVHNTNVNMKHKKKYERYNNGIHNLKGDGK